MESNTISITYQTTARDRPLTAIRVHRAAGDPRRGWLTADGWTVPVALGRGGILANKREANGGMRFDDEIQHAAAIAANGPADENHDRLMGNQNMLDKNAIAAASKTLHDHWRAGTKFSGLDESLRPRDRIEAYAIQARIEK